MNGHFTKEDMHMTNKYTKKYVQYFNHEPLGIGKLNHNGQHYITIRTVKTKLQQYLMLFEKDTEKLDLSHVIDRNVKWYSNSEKIVRLFLKRAYT